MYTNAQTVDLSSIDFTPSVPVDSVYVGGTGDLKVDMLNGATVSFLSVPAGTILPIRASKIYRTGTDATEIVALWGREEA